MRRIGLEMNASVLRAVQGTPGHYPQPIAFDADDAELPMLLDLEKSAVVVGRTARAAVRIKPHLVCRDFLPHLGDTGARAMRWQAGRHRLDADGALALVWQRLHSPFKGAGQVVAALPGYLTPDHADVVRRVAAKAKIPLIGTITAPLAAALIGFAEQAWMNSVVVLDVDEHALTFTHLQAIDGQARLRESRALPTLGLRAWTERLLNCLADVCVWQTRRDPRDMPAAEQGLYDQLEGLFEATLQGRVLQIGVQANQWYQNLLVSPEQTIHFCGQLLKSLQAELESFLQGCGDGENPPAFLVTHAAGRLPGLDGLLRRFHEAALRRQATVRARTPRTVVEDFGEDLLAASGQAISGTTILSSDALARSAHAFEPELGEHQEEAAPLPLLLPAEVGPARLVFQGQNHYLQATGFSIGTHVGCQLVFDPQRHPEVAGRHCEIVFQQLAFVLTNRSREGTLVNDALVAHSIVLRAGDWIRLGAHGPIMRFLGEGPLRSRVTTA